MNLNKIILDKVEFKSIKPIRDLYDFDYTYNEGYPLSIEVFKTERNINESDISSFLVSSFFTCFDCYYFEEEPNKILDLLPKAKITSINLSSLINSEKFNDPRMRSILKDEVECFYIELSWFIQSIFVIAKNNIYSIVLTNSE